MERHNIKNGDDNGNKTLCDYLHVIPVTTSQKEWYKTLETLKSEVIPFWWRGKKIDYNFLKKFTVPIFFSKNYLLLIFGCKKSLPLISSQKLPVILLFGKKVITRLFSRKKTLSIILVRAPINFGHSLMSLQ